MTALFELNRILRLPRARAFKYLMWSSLLSLCGDGLFILSSIMLVKEMSGGVAALSHLFILTMVPSVVLAPFAGALIDRFPRSRLAVGCQLVRALVHVATSCMLLTGSTSLAFLYIAVILNDTLYYVLVPTTDSLTRELLSKDEYVRGESVLQGSWQVGLMLASLAAGILMSSLGLRETYLCAGIAYAASGLVLVRVDRLTRHPITPSKPAVPSGAYSDEIIAGWRYIRQRPTLLLLSIAATMSLPVMQALNILIGPFNTDRLGGDELTLGLIDAAIGLGGIVSAIATMALAQRARLGSALVVSLVLLAGSLLWFLASGAVTHAMLAYGAVGTFLGMFKVLSKSLIYSHVDSEFTGRTMTAISMVSLLLAIGISFVIGQVGEHSLEHAYLLLIGLLAIPTLAILLAMPRGLSVQAQ